MVVRVNGVESEREVDYYMPRRTLGEKGYHTVQFAIPVFNPKLEYIYENSRELQIFSKGWVQDTQF